MLLVFISHQSSVLLTKNNCNQIFCRMLVDRSLTCTQRESQVHLLSRSLLKLENNTFSPNTSGRRKIFLLPYPWHKMIIEFIDRQGMLSSWYITSFMRHLQDYILIWVIAFVLISIWVYSLISIVVIYLLLNKDKNNKFSTLKKQCVYL